ncbi:flagellar hook-length control protein FliK [Rhodanobacter aciditrophus]|uniref:flagellar hook-length control protein FliK n=1 Tax=Rhodanobacter aciditrophus TaxID=1623218 RepID=UPI003CECE5CC
MSTPATTPATSATNALPAAGATSRGQAAAAPLDAALLMAQAAPAVAAPLAAEAGDAVTAAAKTAGTSKSGTPDEEAAATLAGAMLALLGQAAGSLAGASPAADDATVSADGAASGQARASVLSQGTGVDGTATPQGTGADGEALAAAVAAATAPGASPAGIAAGVEHALASTAVDARKDHGLAALALATTPVSAPAAPAPALPQLQLSSPPGSAGFAGELGQQVAWLGRHDIQQAKIRLHPEDLGTLDVHLSVSHDRVDVVFSAQHPAAVAAVQQSLPQLDHMLARHGLSLGHAEVGQQQSRGDEHARGERRAHAAVDEVGDTHGAGLPLATSRVGLLDAFA